MTNPIIHSSLFGAPESYMELDLYIRQLPADQRQVAYLISMMTSNLCYKLIEAEKAKELV